MKCRVKLCSFAFAVAAVGVASVPQALAQTYTVGGAVYTDLANPLTSGLPGVTVTVDGNGGTFEGVTSGGSGVWFVTEVPEGTYTVTPTLDGWCFNHVQSGVGDPRPPIIIVVDADHQGENLSIQFLAGQDCAVCGDESCDSQEDSNSCPEDCYCGNGTCDSGEDSCNCLEDCGGSCDTGACCYTDDTCSDDTAEVDCVTSGGRYLGDGVTCDGDPDADKVFGCDDVCPTTPAPGGVDASGRPLGDLDKDCDVDLVDYSIMQLNFSGPFAGYP